MEFKGLKLDQFQIDAIHAIEKDHSVIVSAATGTGKTLIADYCIDKFLKQHKQVVYTAPIKALSNQKFKDFKEEYGEENVGIMTGDVVINPQAQVLVMTTEIYRNMLLTNDPSVEKVKYIIFDEIHFISDYERGTVWEESIIFSPEHVRFICLSATIPNSKEFSDWIGSIKKHPIEVVKYDKRAVPLTHYLYDTKHGMINATELQKKIAKEDEFPDYYRTTGRNGKKGKRKKVFLRPPSHLNLVRDLHEKDLLPSIFFVFSRKACETKAEELAQKNDFLNREEKAEVVSVFASHMTEEVRLMESTHLLKKTLQRGIGIHHAGILPVLKEIVEILFAKGLIKVLYATETFAVGINMPAKSVCFNSLDKFDGIHFRYLNSKEYFQMAGRAGRRGLDKEGVAVALVDRKFCDLPKIAKFTTKDTDPIISQFKLSINSVLNMVNNHTDEEIAIILKSNFDYYLRSKQNKNIRIVSSYNNRIKLLKRLGYLEEHHQNGKSFDLTDKGKFASYIYTSEILVSEIFSGELGKQLNELETILVIGSIIYEGRRGVKLARGPKTDVVPTIQHKLFKNETIRKELNIKNMRDIEFVVTKWADGCEFLDLLDLSDMAEGDYIRLFRQITDLIQQISKATRDPDMEEKLTRCMNMMYRDVIKVEFS